MKYIILFCFTVHLSLYSQEIRVKDYMFLDKHIEADLNYTAIDSINNYGAGLFLLDSVFNVVDGKYIIYRFLNYDSGILCYDCPIMDIYNLIILKTNKKNKIIDGYWYSLTNPDMPSKCFLYRVSQKNVKLIHNLNTEKLKIKRESVMFQNEDMCDVIPFFLEEFAGKGRLILRNANNAAANNAAKSKKAVRIFGQKLIVNEIGKK